MNQSVVKQVCKASVWVCVLVGYFRFAQPNNRSFLFQHERAVWKAKGGRGALGLNYLASQWASSEPCDGQARPLQHGPPPYDSVFYSVFRAAASHVVFLQDQISQSLVCSHCAVASTAADTAIGVCYGLDRRKEYGYLEEKKKFFIAASLSFFISWRERKKRVCLYLDFE